MFKFTRTGIFCIATTIIFSLLQIFICQISINTERNEEIMQKERLHEPLMTNNNEKIEIWKIEIPKIKLIADISEGTTKEVLNQNIGHFEITSRKEGNVGLAAHNRGYEINYFKDLKLLKKGDEIKYQYNEFEKIYEVEKCRIIKDEEWQYLEETEDNMLTLITGIENEPEYRRCILAAEKQFLEN